MSAKYSLPFLIFQTLLPPSRPRSGLADGGGPVPRTAKDEPRYLGDANDLDVGGEHAPEVGVFHSNKSKYSS